MEEEVGSQATDSMLFRTVQKRLLDDDQLEDVAIAARVEGGVVYLTGTVPDPALGERAAAIAADVPGVSSVQSRIQTLGGVGGP